MPARTQPLLERGVLQHLYFDLDLSIKPQIFIDRDKNGRIAAKLSAGRDFAAQHGWPFRIVDQKPEGKV